MRFEIPIAVALALLLGGCGKNESDAPASDSTAAGAPPAANTGFDYTCADGSTFNARIDRGNAVLTIDGTTVTLSPDASASGAHYASEGTTFIATGREATLIRAGEKTRTCETK